MLRLRRLVMHVVILDSILLATGIRFYAAPWVATSLLGILALVCFGSVVICLMSSKLAPVGLFVVAMLLIALELSSFGWKTGQTPNYNTGFQFALPLAFIYFCSLDSD